MGLFRRSLRSSREFSKIIYQNKPSPQHIDALSLAAHRLSWMEPLLRLATETIVLAALQFAAWAIVADNTKTPETWVRWVSAIPFYLFVIVYGLRVHEHLTARHCNLYRILSHSSKGSALHLPTIRHIPMYSFVAEYIVWTVMLGLVCLLAARVEGVFTDMDYSRLSVILLIPCLFQGIPASILIYRNSPMDFLPPTKEHSRVKAK